MRVYFAREAIGRSFAYEIMVCMSHSNQTRHEVHSVNAALFEIPF